MGEKLPHLVAWRTHACLSQSELARIAGFSLSNIKSLETMRTGAPVATMRALAQALGITPRMLIDHPPLHEAPIPDQYAALQPLEDYLFARIMERVRRELEAM